MKIYWQGIILVLTSDLCNVSTKKVGIVFLFKKVFKMQPTGLRMLSVLEMHRKDKWLLCITVRSNMYIQMEKCLADSNMQLVILKYYENFVRFFYYKDYY